MEQIINYIPEILLLLFLIITFLQSSLEKVFNWAGNLSWLKGHFKDTPLQNLVSFLLVTLLLMEFAAGLVCLLGVLQLAVTGDHTIAFYGAIVSSLTFLMLLFGQRIAKDYEGAKTIVIYFIPAVFLVYLLQP